MKKKENLRQRAYLNSITTLLDFGASQIAAFIANPFIVSGLGSTFYGVWQMLGQMTGYANLADTRATQVLKWSIAKNRDTSTDAELRSEVTSALIVTAVILPIVLIFGGVISWYSPYITGVSSEYYNLVRITCSLLILYLVTRKVFAIFESILRGMNVGYKRMGIRAVIVLLGGGMKIAAIQLGYGLIGLAVTQVIVAVITGMTLFFIVKKHIGWFGFGKTNFKKVISFGKLSGWFIAWTGANMLLLGSDKLILGVIAGPALVTKYTITMFISLAVQGVVKNTIHGIIPGIAGIIGKKDYRNAIKIREHLMIITWLIVTSFGSVIVLLNESFIGLWIGDEHFAGNTVNLFMVLIIFQTVFIDNDNAIIKTTLDIRTNVLLSFGASAIYIILAFILLKDYGIIGLCISIILGRSLLSFGFPYIINNKFTDKSSFSIIKIFKPLIVTIAVFGISYLLAEIIIIKSWIYLILTVPVALFAPSLICWLFGLRSEQRAALKDYYYKIKLFKND